jgi:predicted outer membrane repeat protein
MYRTHTFQAMLTTATLATTLLARVATAQSFNIDFDLQAGAGPYANAPADSFIGAAGQPGHWERLDINDFFQQMHDINDVATGAFMSVSGLDSGQHNDSGSLTGDYEKLLGDWQRSDPNDVATYAVYDLLPGVYTVYTYATNTTDSTGRTLVSVVNSPQEPQSIGGVLSFNSFVQGVTHARHDVVIESNDVLIIHATGTVGFGAVNGLQLHYNSGLAPASGILMVDGNASGNGSGASWPNACRELRDGLLALSMLDDADEVWVANGTHKPTGVFDRTRSFVIPSGKRVYGGFAGGEDLLSQRNPAAHVCTLTGNIGQFNLTSDNSYHVVTLNSTNGFTVFDGFTIQDGNANAVGSAARGGGLEIAGGHAQIRNCIIQNNLAHYGAGVWSDAEPMFVRTRFSNNDATSPGGAVRMFTGGYAEFYNCSFFGNRAGTVGAAVSLQEHAGQFINCVFSGNIADDDGGAIHAVGEAADLLIEGCTLGHNTAFDMCGGIHHSAGADLLLYNSILWNNADFNANTDARLAQYSGIGAASAQTLEYNIVQGWNVIGGGPGNSGLSPQFIDYNGVDNMLGTADDNLRVEGDSAAIDSGANAHIGSDDADLDTDNNTIEFTPLDLDNQPRRRNDSQTIDTGEGLAPIVDRGAYEYIRPCPADISPDGGDGAVNVDDLILVIVNWGVCSKGGCPADIDGNGIVDVDDLIAVIVAWGGCP